MLSTSLGAEKWSDPHNFSRVGSLQMLKNAALPAQLSMIRPALLATADEVIP